MRARPIRWPGVWVDMGCYVRLKPLSNALRQSPFRICRHCIVCIIKSFIIITINMINATDPLIKLN